MIFHLAFAETLNHHDYENPFSVTSSTPLLYQDESEFPPLNPLKEGWQLVDDDNAFTHELIQDADDWEYITMCIKEPVVSPPLYVDIARKKLGTHEDDGVMKTDENKSAKESGVMLLHTTMATTTFARRRRYSSKFDSENKSVAVDHNSLDLGQELHGQYKSARRRHRQGMYISASARRYHHRYHRAALHPLQQQQQQQQQPAVTIVGVPEQSPSNTKKKHTANSSHRSIKKTTTGESKLALVQLGLDWTVCH